jgi:hypothetical protein
MDLIKLTSKEMDLLALKYGDGMFKTTHKEVQEKLGKKIMVIDEI